jgi:antitoxin VapB
MEDQRDNKKGDKRGTQRNHGPILLQGRSWSKPIVANRDGKLPCPEYPALTGPPPIVYPAVYTEETMKTAKIFRSGNSQAVRIPKEFQMEGEEVEIQRRGASLVLRPKKKSWSALFESLQRFTDDFMKRGRKQPRLQKRDRAFL